MSSHIKYQSEITIIFPAKNGKPITFDKGERKLILPLCAGSSWAGCHPLLSDFRLADYHNSLDFMRNRTNTCWFIVCDFRRWFFAVYFKPLQGNTNGDIYHDIRKLCNDVFCRKEILPMRFSLVSMPRPLPSSPNSTWNCSKGCPNTNIYECMGKWLLTIFLDSFIALFDRNRSESSFGRQISGQFSIESSHIISWRFYLAFAKYNLKSWMGKKLSSNTCSTQLSTVLSNFICSFF